MNETKEFDLLPWIIGSFVICATLIAMFITLSDPSTSTPTISAAPYAAAKKADYHAAVRSVPALQPSSTAALLPRGQVWQCFVNGQLTFSDSPCGNTALIRQLNQVNRMDAEEVPAPATSYNSPVPSDTPAYLNPNNSDGGNDTTFCESLKAEVTSIDERMQRGYSIPEGEYLRARLRKISDIQFQKNCHR